MTSSVGAIHSRGGGGVVQTAPSRWRGALALEVPSQFEKGPGGVPNGRERLKMHESWVSIGTRTGYRAGGTQDQIELGVKKQCNNSLRLLLYALATESDQS